MASLKPQAAAVRVVKPKEPAEEVRSGTGFHIGETLREARQQRGLDLEMVANELMIRRFYLEALEGGSFKDLPERVYATGFVRNYANYLGMDGPQAVEQFKREAYGARGSYQVDLVMPEPIAHSIVPGKSAILGALAALVIMIAAIVFATRDKGAAVPGVPDPVSVAAVEQVIADIPEPVEEVAPPTIEPPAPVKEEAPIFEGAPPEPEISSPVVQAPVASEAAPALPEVTATPTLPSEEAPAADPVVPPVETRLVLEALQSSWVEIKDGNGIVLFTNILKEGQMLPIPDQDGVTLTTGNAGGLRLILDGKALPPLGRNNEVKRNVALDADKLGSR